jgi:hypothetical protein
MFSYQTASIAVQVKKNFSHFHMTGYDVVIIYQCTGFCNHNNYFNKFTNTPLYIIYII